MADDSHGAPVKFSQSRDDRLVVGITTIPVQLDKIRKQETDKIQGVRTLLVTRDLRALPRPHMGVKLAAQFPDLVADALQFRVGIRVPGQVAQFLDIFFQALDFFLAVALFRTGRGRSGGFGFFFWPHSGTIRTAGWAPNFPAPSTQLGRGFSASLS